MTTKTLEAAHIDECLSLLEIRYGRERDSVQALPPFSDYLPALRSRYEAMAKKGSGRILAAAGRIRGMMGGFPVEGFFGRDKGVFVPVWANLIATDDAGLLTELYSACAAEWVKEGLTSHAVNLFAHDHLAREELIGLGFGLRCVDAVRVTARLLPGPPAPEVRPVERDGLGALADLHRHHNAYYRGAPMFMPTPEEDPVADLQAWMEGPQRKLLGYFEDGRCRGYLRFQEAGESCFSSHRSMMSITALFVEPEDRGRSIGAALLDAAEAWLLAEGRSLTGVDYESLNPLGSRFWARHFLPYTLSLTRRIDERIIPQASSGWGA